MAVEFTQTLDLAALDNPLTEQTNDYYLQVNLKPNTVKPADVARVVVQRLGMNLDAKLVETILNSADQVMADAVASGYVVSTPLAVLKASASGKVLNTELMDAPDRNKVKLSTAFAQGPLLRTALADCRLNLFSQPAPVGPRLGGSEAATRNPDGSTRVVSSGTLVYLKGKGIKLAGDNEAVGILLTSMSNPSKTVFIAPADVPINEPRRLGFVLPATVTDGSWKVRVTTQFSSSKYTLKEPRFYDMPDPMLVGTAPETPGGGGSGSGGGLDENPLG